MRRTTNWDSRSVVSYIIQWVDDMLTQMDEFSDLNEEDDADAISAIDSGFWSPGDDSMRMVLGALGVLASMNILDETQVGSLSGMLADVRIEAGHDIENGLQYKKFIYWLEQALTQTN